MPVVKTAILPVVIYFEDASNPVWVMKVCKSYRGFQEKKMVCDIAVGEGRQHREAVPDVPEEIHPTEKGELNGRMKWINRLERITIRRSKLGCSLGTMTPSMVEFNEYFSTQ